MRIRKQISINRWRTAVQILAVILLNPFVYRYMGVCVPVLNCWACPAAAFGCPIGVAGNLLAHGILPLAALGSVVFFAMIAGRILCGWICPFGFLQDLLAKIPSPYVQLPRRFSSLLFLLPLSFLLVTVILVPLVAGSGSVFFFCKFCPAGTMEAALPNHFSTSELGFPAALLAVLSSWRVWILIAFLVISIFMKRPFCRLMCPIGIALGLLNRISFLKINLASVKKCSECDLCTEACPVDLHANTQVNSRDCIHCYECTQSCPPRNVIKKKAKENP